MSTTVRRGRIAGLACFGLLVTLLVAMGGGSAGAAPTLDPAVEASNFSKTQERQTIYDTPQYQSQLATLSAQSTQDGLLTQVKDPERNFVGDLCWNLGNGCAGDIRLNNWGPNGYGIVKPVLFTARDGATLSGHVWATKSGPAQRPGIVITNGSVQADEQMYWYVAQTLAKAGYVVLTFDPQGQGQSDSFGEGADHNEGFPAQSDGRPFFDGTEDALNFFFSTPQQKYVPESSCSTGTSHAAKQSRRVAAGLDAAYNPLWQLFDHKNVGLAGHSYGAAGVSYIGQWDPRVDAIVAWDNLSQPSPGTNDGSFPPGEAGCPAHPQDRTDMTPQLAKGVGKPALGMSADYFLPPTPNTSYPDQSTCPGVEKRYEQGQKPSMTEIQTCKSLASDEYSKHGIDSGEIVIRGGSHLDFSFIPNQGFGATLRGADEIAWYTTAWFDKYVKRNPKADARLLTNRWLHDSQEAAIDPGHDGNMFSFYHPSRLEIHTFAGQRQVTRGRRMVRRAKRLGHQGHKRHARHLRRRGRKLVRTGSEPFDCEDMRSGCGGALRAPDGWPGEYSYVGIDTTSDHVLPGTLDVAQPSPQKRHHHHHHK
jgi:dienelactone hydrolase